MTKNVMRNSVGSRCAAFLAGAFIESVLVRFFPRKGFYNNVFFNDADGIRTQNVIASKWMSSFKNESPANVAKGQ